MNFFFSSRRRHTFFFQAEDGIRDRSPSRGLGDVYKRQLLADNLNALLAFSINSNSFGGAELAVGYVNSRTDDKNSVSYTHLTLPTICSV